jgi:hypothetical protein
MAEDELEEYFTNPIHIDGDDALSKQLEVEV